MAAGIRIGLIGLGNQMRRHHIPYLEKRLCEDGDIEIAWIAIYPPHDKPDATHQYERYNLIHEDELDEWLTPQTCDCALISIPNALHAETIRTSLRSGIHVAVEKPTTTGAKDCAELVELAEERDLIFVTMSQRRYEYVYQQVKEILVRGEIGRPLLLSYLIAHEYFEPTWARCRLLAGGGVLMASAYHGIDTMLWLMRACNSPPRPVRAKAVSAHWIVDHRDYFPLHERIEVAAAAQILLDNGCVFSVAATFEGPEGSVDEDYKLFGTEGTVRIIRDRTEKRNSSAARLSLQSRNGDLRPYDTEGHYGMEDAPLEDFLAAVAGRRTGQRREVLSPARDSIETIRIIETAYESASLGGKEMLL